MWLQHQMTSSKTPHASSSINSTPQVTNGTPSNVCQIKHVDSNSRHSELQYSACSPMFSIAVRPAAGNAQLCHHSIRIIRQLPLPIKSIVGLCWAALCMPEPQSVTLPRSTYMSWMSTLRERVCMRSIASHSGLVPSAPAGPKSTPWQVTTFGCLDAHMSAASLVKLSVCCAVFTGILAARGYALNSWTCPFLPVPMQGPSLLSVSCIKSQALFNSLLNTCSCKQAAGSDFDGLKYADFTSRQFSDIAS